MSTQDSDKQAKEDAAFAAEAEAAKDGTPTIVGGAEIIDNSESEEELRREKVLARIKELANATDDNVVSCAKLDFQLVKPHIQILNIILYVGATGFLSFTTGNALLGFIAGFLLGTLYLSYPFAIAEKYQTSKVLKASGLSSSTVVGGRFLFSMIFSAAAAIGALAIASLGAHFSNAEQPILATSATMGTFIIMLALYLTLIMVQLAAYFKLGFTGARYAGLIPVGVTAMLVWLIFWLGGGEGVIPGLQVAMNWVDQNYWFVIAAAITFVVTRITAQTFSHKVYEQQLSEA